MATKVMDWRAPPSGAKWRLFGGYHLVLTSSGLVLLFCTFHMLVSGVPLSLADWAGWAASNVAAVVMAYALLQRTSAHEHGNGRGMVAAFVAAVAVIVAMGSVLTLAYDVARGGSSPTIMPLVAPRLPAAMLLAAVLIALVRLTRERSVGEDVSAELFGAPATSKDRPEAEARCSPRSPSLQRRFLELPDGHLIPDVSLVQWATAAANYAEIKIGEKVIISRITMNRLETLLRPSGFERVHRSTIINWAGVARVAPEGGRLIVYMKTGERFAVGRKYRDRIGNVRPAY